MTAYQAQASGQDRNSAFQHTTGELINGGQPRSAWSSTPRLELAERDEDSEDLITAMQRTDLFGAVGAGMAASTESGARHTGRPYASQMEYRHSQALPPPPPPNEAPPQAPSSPTISSGSHQRRERPTTSGSRSIYGVVTTPQLGARPALKTQSSSSYHGPRSPRSTGLSNGAGTGSPAHSVTAHSSPGRHGHMPALPHFTEAFAGPVRIVVVGAPGCGKSSLVYKALQAEEGGWESFSGNSVLAGSLYMSISKASSPSHRGGPVDGSSSGGSQQEVTLLEVDPTKINVVDALKQAAQNQNGAVHGVMLVYDASAKSSLAILPDVLDTLADLKIPTILLAAKSDLPMHIDGVNPKTGAKLGSYFGVGLIEVSVKHELGRQKMRDGFSYLLKRIIRAWEAAQTSRITTASHHHHLNHSAGTKGRSRGSSFASQKSMDPSTSPYSLSMNSPSMASVSMTGHSATGHVLSNGLPASRGRHSAVKSTMLSPASEANDKMNSFGQGDRQLQVNQALAFLNGADVADDSSSSDEVHITTLSSMTRPGVHPQREPEPNHIPLGTTSSSAAFGGFDNALHLTGHEREEGTSGSSDAIDGRGAYASALPSPERSLERSQERALDLGDEQNHVRDQSADHGELGYEDRSVNGSDPYLPGQTQDSITAHNLHHSPVADDQTPSSPSATALANYSSPDEIMSKVIEAVLQDRLSDFVKIFLMFYRKFALPKTLFDRIEDEYMKLHTAQQEDQMMVRLREMKLCQFLLTWVNDDYNDFCDPELHERLVNMVESLSHESHLIHYSTELLPLTRKLLHSDPDAVWAHPGVGSSTTNSLAIPTITAPLIATVPPEVPVKAAPERQTSLPPASDGKRHSASSASTAPKRVTQSSRRASVASLGSSSGDARRSSGGPAGRLLVAQFLNTSDAELALELTRLEWVLFSRISGREMFRHIVLAGKGSTTPKAAATVAAATASETAAGGQFGSVAQSIAFFNRISSWVQTMILSESTITGRAKVLTKMMGIAEALRAFNNFNTLLAVLAGINAGPVHRLRSTHQIINGQAAQKAFKRLEKLMSSDKSFSAYRLALRSSTGPVIPYLGVHLQDLLYVYQANQDVRESDGKVHWQKLALMGEVVLGVLRCHDEPFTIGAHGSIEEMIKSTKILTEDQLYERSLVVEPKRIEAGNGIAAASVRRGGMGNKK